MILREVNRVGEGQKNVPKLRFKGYEDAWEQRKLGDVKDVRDGTHDSPKYIPTGYPLVTSKNLTENGLDYSDISYISEDDFFAINKRSKVEIGDIIFGMIGTIGNPVMVKSEGFAIKNVALLKNNGIINNSFLIHLLKSPIFTKYIKLENAGGTQKFLGLSQIRNFECLIPNEGEQVILGDFFLAVDNLITLHQRKYDALKSMKKTLLSKMFPKNGEDVPEIRFKEFTDAWEQRKLEDIADVSIGEFVIKSKQNDDAPYPVFNGGKECTGYYDEFNNEANKIVISARGANAGFVNIVEKRFWAGNSCYSISIKDEKMYHLYFLYQFIKFEESLFTEFQQAANIPSVSKKDVLFFSVVHPLFEEQNEIGNFYRDLDSLITLHQRKLEELKNMKKTLLQQMFV